MTIRVLLRRFARDERGQVSVLFALGVMFVVATVLMIAAGGQRYVQKEVVQSAADAAAMAGAVVEAKALNVISFTNIVMSFALAIFMMLRGIAEGLQAFIPVGRMLCAAHQADFCAFDPTAVREQAAYAAAAERLRGELRALAAGERALAQTASALAQLEVARVGRDRAFQRNYGSGLSAALVPATPPKLPVEDGTWSDLHDHALAHAPRFGGIALGRLSARLAGAPPRPSGMAQGSAALGIPRAIAETRDEPDATALPLQLARDWRDRKYVRVEARLAGDDARWRRRLAGIAAKQKRLPGSEQTTATAQAEVFAFNRHEDLWHMGWRARLSLSKPFVPVPAELRPFWVH